MAIAAPLAAGASLLSGVMGGMGAAAGDKYAAGQAERAAFIGRTKAAQTDTQMREELATTIANIQAVRAAAGMEYSPTEQGVIDEERRVSDRERTIRVDNIKSQVASDEASAKFYRSSAKTKLFGGIVGGLVDAAGYLK